MRRREGILHDPCNETITSWFLPVTLAAASRASNCQVSQIGYNGGPSAVGIFSDGALVQNSIVSTNYSSTGYGIFLKGAVQVAASFAIGNTISGCPIGIGADTDTSGGKYQSNLTVGCTTTFSDGTDAGGNN